MNQTIARWSLLCCLALLSGASAGKSLLGDLSVEEECSTQLLLESLKQLDSNPTFCQISHTLHTAIEKCSGDCGLANYLHKKIGEAVGYFCDEKVESYSDMTNDEKCVEAANEFHINRETTKNATKMPCEELQKTMGAIDKCPKTCLGSYYKTKYQVLADTCKSASERLLSCESQACRDCKVGVYAVGVAGAAGCSVALGFPPLVPICLAGIGGTVAAGIIACENNGFRQCCEEKKVGAGLQAACNYTMLELGIGQLIDYFPLSRGGKNMPPFFSSGRVDQSTMGYWQCFTKQKDATECCRAKGVKDDCLAMCNGARDYSAGKPLDQKAQEAISKCATSPVDVWKAFHAASKCFST